MSQPNIAKDAQQAVEQAILADRSSKDDKSAEGAYDKLMLEVQAEMKKISNPAQFHQFEKETISDLNKRGMLPEVSLEFGKAQATYYGGAISRRQLENPNNPLSGDSTNDPLLKGLTRDLGDNFNKFANARDANGDTVISTSAFNAAIAKARTRETKAASVDVGKLAAASTTEVENAPGFNKETTASALLKGEIQEASNQVSDGKMSTASFAKYVADLESDLKKDGHKELAVDAKQDGAEVSKLLDQTDSNLSKKAATDAREAADAPGISSETTSKALLKDEIQSAYNAVRTGKMSHAEFAKYLADLESDLTKSGHKKLAGDVEPDASAVSTTSGNVSEKAAAAASEAENAPGTNSDTTSTAILKGEIQGAYTAEQAGKMSKTDFDKYVTDLESDLIKAGRTDLASDAQQDAAALVATPPADGGTTAPPSGDPAAAAKQEAQAEILQASTCQPGDGYWQVAERLTELVTGTQNPTNQQVSNVWLELMSVDNVDPSNPQSTMTHVGQPLLNSTDFQAFLTNLSQNGIPLNSTYQAA